MNPLHVDLTPLARAIGSLDAVLCRLDQETETALLPFLRDATVKRFEFTFELGWKMLRRVLVADGDTDVISTTGARAILRRGRQAGYIADVEAWFGFLEARNDTAHSYDEALAAEVVATARVFLPAAKALLERLATALERDAAE